MDGPQSAAPEQKDPAKTRALRFVLLIGVVSFFADFTYEGSRSIVGPYLAVLGASATAVGIVAGFGELLGYALRLVSAQLSEKTGQFWPITLFGYVIQMAAVPLLALAGSWQVAALLIVVERIGKATRNPPRDVIIAVHEDDPQFLDCRDIADLPPHRLRELQRFFLDYKVLEGEEVVVDAPLGVAAAMPILRDAVALYARERNMLLKKNTLQSPDASRR